MKEACFLTTLLVFVSAWDILRAQPSLEWLNRTGTQHDEIFDSRLFFSPDYLFHPLTRNQYLVLPDDEFEVHRLRQSLAVFQSIIEPRWKNGFILQVPVDAVGVPTKSSFFKIGTYDFAAESFPLNFVGGFLDFPLYRNDVDRSRLRKTTVAKETKYAYAGRGAVRLLANKLAKTQFSLKVPKRFAEAFKEFALAKSIGLQLIIDFDGSLSFASESKPTEHFMERVEAWGHSKITERDLNRYLEEFGRTYGRPLELLQCLVLRFSVNGFRVVDHEQVILFEWLDSDATSGAWSVSNSSTNDGGSILVDEQPLHPSLTGYSDDPYQDPWHKETMVSRFYLDEKQVSNDERRSFLMRDFYQTKDGVLTSEEMNSSSDHFSWWDCDFYLKRMGKRLPTGFEIRQAFLNREESTIRNLETKHNPYEIVNRISSFESTTHFMTGPHGGNRGFTDEDRWGDWMGFRGVHH